MTAQPTAEEIYARVVKPLPASERLKLATIILNDISPHSVVDYSEEWSEEDMRDFTMHSMRYAAESLGEYQADCPLPEDARVETAPPDPPPGIPPELQAEFDAWDRASAEALDLVERLAREQGMPERPGNRAMG